MDSRAQTITWHLLVGVAFLATSYTACRYKVFERKKQIKSWLDNELPRLLRKHQSTVSMYLAKAKSLQSQSSLKILAAYYGKKSNIKDFVDAKIYA
jgi:hypothetical protein